MRIDVFFTPAEATPAQLSGRVVAVLDILRASTTVAVALANGAKAVVPFDSADEVIRRAKSFERSEVLLAGERRMLPIDGFDLGNSPAEFAPDVVEGKTVLLSTTNGTGALASIQGAREVIVASYVNFGPVVALLRTALNGGTDVALLCAGRERQFSLEDAACAGRFARHLARRATNVQLNDAARAAILLDRRYGERVDRLFADSAHGRALIEAGFEQDLATCAALDSHRVIPVYQDRAITKIGPDRER
ncbi:MAG: 2-phosphosulfolactate phosphatase [Gemmatimonadaceae bacterium]